jgi:hypothetical protein
MLKARFSLRQLLTVRFSVLSTPCRSGKVQCFGGIYCLYLQGSMLRQVRYQREADDKLTGCLLLEVFLSYFHTEPPQGEARRLALRLQMRQFRDSQVPLTHFRNAPEPAASLAGARFSRIPEGAPKGHMSAHSDGAPEAQAA